RPGAARRAARGGAQSGLYARSRAAAEAGPDGSRCLRRRGHAVRSARRRGGGRGPARAGRDRPAHGVPARARGKHRGDDRARPDRGDAAGAAQSREELIMPVRYVITTLKKGVKPEDYERWLREYDYRVAETLPSIVSYRTHRIEGPINGAEGA